MSNIILLFYTVICCIDYCFAVGIHRLEGEDGRWRKRTRRWRERTGDGEEEEGAIGVKYVTVVKYYGKN